MTPPGKIIVNFHTGRDGTGDTIKESTTVDADGKVIETPPGRIRVPGLAASMSITFDDPIPLADVVQNELPPPEK